MDIDELPQIPDMRPHRLPAQDLARRYKAPVLYPKQYAAIYAPERYAVIEASTKSGKTFACMDWLIQQALGQPESSRTSEGEHTVTPPQINPSYTKEGYNYWWLAPSYAQARIAYRRYKQSLPRPDWFDCNNTLLEITLPNGAVLTFKTGDDPDNLYGENVYAAVIDEATRVKEDAWFALRSTLTYTKGPVRIIGNVHGKHNWAFKLARVAQSGAPNYHYAKLTAYDAVAAGVLDASEIEDARAALPESVFNELYLAEASEDGANPFDAQAILACTGPLAPGPAVCWGWDLARGKRPGTDWTVGYGLNRDRQVCEEHRFQGPWDAQLLRIRSVTGTTRALVDATGVGQPIVEELQTGAGNFEAFIFSPTSKQSIMGGLSLSIQQRKIRFPAGQLTAELDVFEYMYTRTGVQYSAPEGMHDDCVVALALANAHFPEGSPRVRFM